MPTFRAKEMVMGYLPSPSLEFQFILVSARSSRARYLIEVGQYTQMALEHFKNYAS